MSEKPKILIQFDSDQHPSVFDSIVAIDSDVDHLLTFGAVEAVDVRELVHGAMFTRGVESLKHTAIFIGGSRVQSAEQILRAVVDSFFGPIRVSVMLDANGANTTAAAAVICLNRHLDVAGRTIGVLGATGSVGSRVARLLGSQGAEVRIGSRSMERGRNLCKRLRKASGEDLKLQPVVTDGLRDFDAFVEGCHAIISAGAAGIPLLRKEQWQDNSTLKVLIDLNAVPPVGVEGIEVTYAGEEMAGRVLYGAIGVGNLKMKIHKRSIATLFQANDQVLDIDEIFSIGQQLESDLIA